MHGDGDIMQSGKQFNRKNGSDVRFSKCKLDFSTQNDDANDAGNIAKQRKMFQMFTFLFSANASSYSHYVFSTLDLDDTGVITFEVWQLIKYSWLR